MEQSNPFRYLPDFEDKDRYIRNISKMFSVLFVFMISITLGNTFENNNFCLKIRATPRFCPRFFCIDHQKKKCLEISEIKRIKYVYFLLRQKFIVKFVKTFI